MTANEVLESYDADGFSNFPSWFLSMMTANEVLYSLVRWLMVSSGHNSSRYLEDGQVFFSVCYAWSGSMLC